MTHKEREALRGLCEEATSGPWEPKETPDYMEIHNSDTWGKALAPIALIRDADDAAFIAAARTALPELLEENETLFAEKLDLLSQLELMRLRAEAAEARAEALERALREFAPCETCVGAPDCKIYGQALVCTLFGFKPDAWQFDQARFEKGGERDGH